MTTQTLSTWKHISRLTLSVPFQSFLYISLCSLILYTVFFTTYPPIHDKLHSLRHHTLTVSCH